MDTANVMGARPDGWWRDRAGAAVRLHAELVRLAESGRPILPDETGPPQFVMVLEGAARAASSRISAATTADPVRPAAGDSGPPPAGDSAGPAAGDSGPSPAGDPAGPAAGDSGPSPAGDPAGPAAGDSGPCTAAASPAAPDRVRVVAARGSGDDAIVALVRELPGRRVVVTADRELRDRSAAAGAAILGPGWLLGLLRQ